MTIPEPPAGEQPTYVDPVTGQPLYIDPTTGQLAYQDPTASTVRSPYPGYPGYSPELPPYIPPDPTLVSVPQTGFTAPAYPQLDYGYPAGAYPMFPPTQRTNGLAITSMVLSITGAVTLVCWGIGGLLGVAGAIVGHVARRQVVARGEAGGGMALAGIIVGWVALALGLAVLGFLIWLVAKVNSYNEYTY